MNAGIFLVPTVHEIAIAAELAIAAKPGEKSDTDALTQRPALDAETKSIDASHNFMPRTRGQLMGKSASTVAASEWQTPQASMRIRT
jgi:hypothetical protein